MFRAIIQGYGYTIFFVVQSVEWIIAQVTGEPVGEFGYTRILNLVAAFIMLLGVHIVGRIVQVVTRERWGYLAGLVPLLALPVFSGSGLFNVKDVPVAVALAAAIYVSIALTDRGITFSVARRLELLFLSLSDVPSGGGVSGWISWLPRMKAPSCEGR